MTDKHLDLACEVLGIHHDQVLSYNVNLEDDKITLVVDKGIAGCPKYSLSLSTIAGEPATTEPQEKQKVDFSKRKPADDFDSLSNADLKGLAKELGIKSYWSMKRETLIEKVRNAFDGS